MNRKLRSTLVLGLLMTVGQAGIAAPRSDATQPDIRRKLTIRVFNYAGVPDGTLSRAQDTAAQVYRHAGIEITWLACPTSEAEHPHYAQCIKRPVRPDLVLRLLTSAPPSYADQPEISGAAILAPGGGMGTYASVFFDRVEQMTWQVLRVATEGVFAHNLSTTAYTATTLGMVIAHELGHLLLGVNSHSKLGIMQPSWSRKALEAAFLGRQSFTPKEARRIHANLRAADEAELPLWAENNASVLASKATP